jgi:hypothetical protein
MKKLMILTLGAGVLAISACSSSAPTSPRVRPLTVQRANDGIETDCLASHSGWIVASGEADPCQAP